MGFRSVDWVILLTQQPLKSKWETEKQSDSSSGFSFVSWLSEAIFWAWAEQNDDALHPSNALLFLLPFEEYELIWHCELSCFLWTVENTCDLAGVRDLFWWQRGSGSPIWKICTFLLGKYLCGVETLTVVTCSLQFWNCRPGFTTSVFYC